MIFIEYFKLLYSPPSLMMFNFLFEVQYVFTLWFVDEGSHKREGAEKLALVLLQMMWAREYKCMIFFYIFIVCARNNMSEHLCLSVTKTICHTHTNSNIDVLIVSLIDRWCSHTTNGRQTLFFQIVLTSRKNIQSHSSCQRYYRVFWCCRFVFSPFTTLFCKAYKPF